MITSLRLKNFKNFADETLKLGPFTVIVGANASGKSNIRDAFRFLHGIGRGYTLAEIMGGKMGAGGYVEWDGIRGAPNEVVRFEHTSPLESGKCSLQLKADSNETAWDYSMEIGFNRNARAGWKVCEEGSSSNSEMIFGTTGDKQDMDGLVVHFIDAFREPESFDPHQPVLSQLTESALLPPPLTSLFSINRALRGMRFMELSPARMKDPSVPGATILGDYGQNLPTVLESICADADRKQTLLSWLEELTPMDVQGFEFPRDPSGRVHLYITERNGRKVSAYSASDGTLRFLGILAALLNEDAGGIYFFEEIDNGIHPSRLWLLLDLIERQTAKRKIQVITTTHNPALLAWMNDETFEHTSVVYRDQYWSDSVIRPIAGLYHLRELRKTYGMEGLLTEGWLESAMKLSEGDPDSDHLEGDDEDDWGMDEEE